MEKSNNNKIISRWTDFNTFSTNALKPNWKKNMKKEWSFWITELKRDNRSKVLTRMHIWSWCRTILEISTMLKIWLEVNLDHNLKWMVSHLRTVVFPCLNLIRKILLDQRFLKEITEKKILTLAPKITKRIVNLTTRKTTNQVKEESNITNSILIQLKEPLKWCVSNTNQLLWWDSIKTNRPSKCRIWTATALKCTKVTMEINLWMITEWTFLNLITKCMLLTLISLLRILQNQLGF